MFKLSDRATEYVCIWALSYVLLKYIYDRDTGLSIEELEKTQALSSEQSYTQKLLYAAMTSQSEGPYHLAPGNNTTEEGSPQDEEQAVRAASLPSRRPCLDFMPEVVPYDMALRRLPVIYAAPRFQPAVPVAPRVASVRTHKRKRDFVEFESE
jgi:hypothetical protein